MDRTRKLPDPVDSDLFKFTDTMAENPQALVHLMDMIPYGLCLSDARGRIFYWNPQVEQMTGITKAHALGKTCRQVFDGLDIAPSHPDGGPAGHPCEAVTINAPGRAVHLEKTTRQIRNADGRLLYTMGIFVDLTQQIEARAAIQEGHELVASARNAKRHFMASMTHEIRTPLNGIMGLLDLLLAEDPTPSQQAYLASAKHSARLLMVLVDDILNFTIIDKGEVNIECTGFSLASIIGSVITRQYALIQNKQVSIHSHVEEDVPDNLLGDSGRLYQILKHLVGNAIKFTPAGEVAVRVARVPETIDAGESGARRTLLHFSISDTGIGIPGDKLDTIFESLSQVDETLSRAVGGLGIGLNIVQRLVVLLGGRIWMESEVGRGTTVHLILPFKSAALSETGPSKGPRREGAAAVLSPDRETIVASCRGTVKVDNYPGSGAPTLSLVATPLPPQWFARFETLGELLRHDKPAAEAQLMALKAEAREARQDATATLLFRLLLALRRDDREAVDHYHSMIRRKIASDPGAGGMNRPGGGRREGINRGR